MMKIETRIPDDIFTIILKQLPAKSLLRFKSVCKSWYCLIESSDLVNKHLQYQKDNKKGRLLLQLEDIEKGREVNCISFRDETLTSTEYDELGHIQFNQETKLTRIIGPVKGLFCLSNSHDCIVIWNPTTRKYKLIPPIPPLNQIDVFNKYNVYYEFGAFGFGLDPLTDDCKIVLFLRPSSHVVYSLSTDTWRQVNSLEYEYKYPMPEFYSDCVYVCGVCHWYNYTLLNITTFGVSNEILGAIQGPDTLTVIPNYRASMTGLASCDDILMFVLIPVDPWSDDRGIHIWAMENEGDWVKRLCIKQLSVGFEYVWCGSLKNEDEILIATSKRPRASQALFVSSTTTQENVKEVLPEGKYSGFKSFVYYESLQPVDRGNYVN